MADVLQPRDARDIADAVAEATASGEALEILGGGTKRGIGFPNRQTRQLSTTNLSCIIDYDPAELTLTLEFGARLADVEALLAQHNQMLAFDPWDFAETIAAAPGQSTIGGIVGAGIAGPRRLSAGSVRDHVLGFHAVNGRGEKFKAGGRVVKNVTGYDLSKLVTGSWGQLVVLTELTLKVLPRPPARRTLAIRNLDAATAVRAMNRAMSSPAEVSAAAHAPGLTTIRLEGFDAAMSARTDMLRNALAEFDLTEIPAADAHWTGIRNATAMPREAGALLWRIVVPPTSGATIGANIERLGGTSFMDWAGGLIWARVSLNIAATDVRALATRSGGHAMLIDAPDEVRTATPALHPEPPAVAALSRRVRTSFDPSGVFDPHRFASEGFEGAAMKTEFTAAQLADPATAASEKAIRTCVHCGFCTATCPTYVLLGDERDSPRGRIWLIKDMLEREAKPTPEVVTHIDRCLSCLACVTTCPSGVDYMHLIDHARKYVEDRYERPTGERMLRSILASILPNRRRFALALMLGRIASPAAPVLKLIGMKRTAAMLRLAGANSPKAADINSAPATGVRKGRVLLQAGCAEPVLRPQYQEAATRLLNRLGYDVVRAPNDICCGSLTHHMGREHDALVSVKQTIDAWSKVIDEGVDAIIFTVTGCGTTLKDYGFLMRNDPVYAERAARISALARDITEFVPAASLPPPAARKLRVAYHPACSLQHGQNILAQPKLLLERAGYEVVVPANAHLCCGSAGTYNIMQPDIAGELGDRKTASLDALKADVIATGNIGCAVQIGARTRTPVVHVAELLDWATGGPAPAGLDTIGDRR